MKRPRKNSAGLAFVDGLAGGAAAGASFALADRAFGNAMKKRTKHQKNATHKKKPARKASAKRRPAKVSKKCRETVSRKVKKLRHEGVERKQAVARGLAAARKKGCKIPKKNPETPQETALHLVAKFGKRKAASLARDHEKHARSHGQRSETKRWAAIARGVDRVHVGSRPAPAKKKPRKKNPTLAVLANPAASFLEKHPVGTRCRFGDLPEATRCAIKKSAKGMRRLRAAMRFDGTPMNETLVTVVDTPGDERCLTTVGQLEALRYKKGARSQREGRYHHDAGDHGRGKKKTRAQLVTVDDKGRTILVAQKGTRTRFVADGTRGSGLHG